MTNKNTVIKPETEITLQDFSVIVFHELQAIKALRLIKPRPAKRKQKKTS